MRFPRRSTRRTLAAPLTPRQRRVRSIFRALMLGATAVIGIPLVLALIVLLLLQHDGVARWAAQHVADAVNPYPGTRLTLGGVSGTWVTGLEVRRVLLVSDGDTALSIDTLRATYDPLGFAAGAFAFREVHVAGPAIRLRQLPDSSWDLLRPFVADSGAPAPATPGTSISIASLSVTRGRIAAQFHAPGRDSSLAVEAIELRARDLALGRGTPSVRIDSLSLTARPPASSPGPVELNAAGSLDEHRLDVRRIEIQSPRSRVFGRGTLPRPGAAPDSARMDFTLEALPLAYQDFGPFVPGFDGDGELRVEMAATGTAAMPRVRLRAGFAGGGEVSLDGEASVTRGAPLAYRGSFRVRALDPAQVTGRMADSGRIDADVSLDLAGPTLDSLTGPARLHVPRASVHGLDVRDVAFEAPFDRGRSRLRLRGTVNEMRLDAGGSARPLDSIPSYDVRGSLDDVRRFIPKLLRAGDGPVTTRFEVVGRGVAKRSASGRLRVEVEPTDTGVTNRLRRAVIAARMSDAALIGKAELAIGSAEIDVPFTIGLVDEVAYRVEGATIRRLDAAGLLGAEFPSDVGGTFTLNGRGLGPNALIADVSLALRGRWGGYDSATARITGSARAGTYRGEAAIVLDSARVDVGAELQPFVAVPALSVTRLDLARLDLARLAPGILPASMLTASGTLRASGRDLGRVAARIGKPAAPTPLDLSVHATLDVDEGTVGRVELRRANLAAVLSGDSLRFDGAVDGSAGAARARGDVLLFQQPIGYRVHDARFSALDLGSLVGSGPPTSLTGQAVLSGQGTSLGRLALDGVITLDSSTVRQATVVSSRLQLRARNEELTARGRVVRPHGAVVLAVDAVIPETGRRRVDVRLSLNDTLNVSLGEPLPTELTIGASVTDVAATGERRSLRGTMSAKGRAGAATLDSAYARFEAARGWLTLDTLFVTSALARIGGAGHVAIGDDTAGVASDLAITARLGDLAPLAPLLGARLLGLDSARVDASVRGRSDSLAFETTATGQAFALDDYRLGTLSATARGWIRGDRSLGALEGTLHAGRARVGVVSIGLLQGEASWDGEEWAARGSLVIDDRRQLTAVARVDPRGDTRRVLIESLVLVAGGAPWSLRRPVEARYGDTVSVQGFELASRDGRVTIDGQLDGRADGHLRAELTAIPLGTFSDLVGFPQLAGRLDGTLDVSGTTAMPRATGELVATLGTSEGTAATVTTTFTGYGGRLGVDLRVVDRAGGTLTLAGTIPRTLVATPPPGPGRGASPDSIDLRLATGPSGLRLDVAEPFLDPRAAADLTGLLVADARMAGTAERPVLSGQLTVRDGRVRIPTLGVVYDSIAGRAVLSDSLVRLEAVRIVSGRGAVEIGGTVAIGRGLGRRFDLSVGLSGFSAVATSSYQATLSGQVRLHGVREAPTLEGTVTVRDAHVNLSTSQATANVEHVELTPADLRVLERRFGYGLGGVRSPLDGLYDALTLDLTVQLERNTWLRHPSNPQVVLELVGRVRIRKPPHGELLADGTIEIVPGRSYVEQFGARFEVGSGQVALAGRPEELQFSVKTRHEAGSRLTRREGGTSEPAVVITMDVEGTPDEIRLTLASEPELTDTEIISYLATGRLPNWTPGGGQQEGHLAADIALRQVTRNVQGALGESLPLDVVEVRSDGLRGLTLVAGRYTSPQLYLGVKQPVSFSTDEHTSTTAAKTTEFEVEYEAYRWLLMNLQGGASVLRFFLKTRHDY